MLFGMSRWYTGGSEWITRYLKDEVGERNAVKNFKLSLIKNYESLHKIDTAAFKWCRVIQS